jgi:hydrogenase/urease accessory protein HupE
LETDGQLLKGEVIGFEAAASAAPQALATYQLRFPLPSSITAPRQLSLRQNILNEIMFAPGNPWEAIFVVTVRQGGITLSEGSLFTRNQPVTVSLEASGSTATTTPQPSLLGQYFHHGLTHILEGWDHLLFVCALVLAVTRLSQLLLVVTSFTVAHTLTLVLSVTGFVRLPSGIVEPMIAASIVFVAVQNAFWPERSRGPARLAIAFAFGLFHGLGFAGGLLEAMAGLSPQLVALALIGFAVGVEVGHQIVALPFFGVVHFLRSRQSGAGSVETGRWVPATFQTVSLLIAAAGCFYLVNSLREI